MELDQNNAILLFETVRQFRNVRDQFRLRCLAQVLSLPMPEGDDPSVKEVDELLNRLADKSFGNFKANQFAAQEIQGLLRDLDLRILCTKPGCLKPATLRCTNAGRTKHGMFQFVHAGEGRQLYHFGSTKLPLYFQLVLLNL